MLCLCSLIIDSCVLCFIVDPCAGMKSSDIDPDCMISVADMCCCCLPTKVRKRLRCGVKERYKVGFYKLLYF